MPGWSRCRRTGQDGYTFYIKGHILRRAHNSTLEAEFLPDPCGVEPLLGSRDLNRKKETAGHKHTILQRTQHKLWLWTPPVHQILLQLPVVVPSHLRSNLTSLMKLNLFCRHFTRFKIKTSWNDFSTSFRCDNRVSKTEIQTENFNIYNSNKQRRHNVAL